MGKRVKISVVFFLCSFVLTAACYGKEQEPIKIGFFAPISGPVALAGNMARDGATFAVDEINAKGGINGRKVKLVIYDDRLNKMEAVSVAYRLTERDKVVAVINGSYSGPSMAAAPIYNEKKIPVVTSYASAFEIVKDKPFVFRWGTLADVQGAIGADYAMKDLKPKKIVVLKQDDEYGRGIARGLVETLKKLGGNIVFEKFYSTNEKEFTPVLTAIKPLEPDIVFATGYGITLTSIAREGTEAGIFPKAQFIGFCNMQEMVWFNTVGDAGEGKIGILEFISGIDTPRMKDFLKRWEERHGSRIVAHEAGLTYDAAKFMFDAIRRAGTEPEAIRKALLATKNFEDTHGNMVSCTPMREMFRPMAIGKYDSKEQVYHLIKWANDPKLIDPTPWAKFYN
jgi:branched-chain amino acid transport system substrate-binding protein